MTLCPPARGEGSSHPLPAMTTDNHLLPPESDIQAALEIENNVKPAQRARYLDFLNGKPMSARVTPQELRDGCILSQLFFQSTP